MHCPKCKSNLEGDLIYDTFKEQHPEFTEEKLLEWLSNYCPLGSSQEELKEYAKTKRWGREIGLEWDVGAYSYDGVSLWYCPDCGHVWKRFSHVPDYVLMDAINHYKGAGA